jgi:6-phospho-beta-glucosidase
VNEFKLATIGGGSSYTPDLADILIHQKEELPVKEWVLMDNNAERLEIVGNFTKKMIESAGLSTKVTLTTNLREALQDTNFVITTMRVGLSDSRILDETIPMKYGMLGQETTAPGGLAMGLRNIPVILDVAKEMEEVSAENAWLINLANPSGMLAEAINQYSSIQFAGLCNGPTVARGAMQAVFNVKDPNAIFCKIIGLNHLIWMKVYLNGEDVTVEAMDRLDQWYGENIPPMRTESAPLHIQQFAGWIPVGPYLRYYYELPEAIEDLQHSAERWPTMIEFVQAKLGDLLKGLDYNDLPTRAHMVKALEKRTMALYEKGDVQGYEIARHTRGGRGYGKAGLSLVSALLNNKNEIHGPDVRSQGSIQGLDPNVVATTTSLVNKAGIHPLAMEELPPHMMSFIQSAKKYELLAAEAAVTGNYHAALEALVSNPLVVSFNQAKGALDELLLAHKAYLPKFTKTIKILEAGGNPLKK